MKILIIVSSHLKQQKAALFGMLGLVTTDLVW